MDQTLSRVIRLTQKQVDINQNCTVDQYRFNYLTDSLGEGSFGCVYKAFFREKCVAIKILNLQMYDNPAYKQALKNEILLMMQLQSPNVVKILDVLNVLCDKHDNELFLIIEYCEGGDLRQLLSHQPHQRLPEITAIAILQQAVQGLKELINKGYIHRDIKPDNILIKENLYKIADFGMAVKLPPKQVLRAQAGTPLYMAPQILEGKEYTNKCDIWSLGLVLYELLFGQTPWLCRSFDTYLTEIKSKSLQFPYEIEVSQNVKDFIKKCLKIEERDRMSWNELLQHSALQTNQKIKRQATQERLNFSQIEREYLYNIQIICKNYNIQAKDLMKQCNKTHINLQEFQNMINKIMNKDNYKISDQLFKKFDTSNDGLISASEFEYIFSEYDFAPLQPLPIQIIHEIQAIIKMYKISLKFLFNKFDIDNNGFLDFKEFTNLIKKIAPKLNQKDIKAVFNNYDQDHDGKISPKELQFVLQSQNYVKLKIILEKIQSTLIKKNVSVEQLFQQVDKSQKGYIDINDFEYLLNKLENVNKVDALDLFSLFDEDNDGKISLKEFCVIIKQ